MDAYKAIVSKRDTRAFLDKAVPEDVVHRIVQAGRMAGSSKNTQPCRFVVLDDADAKAGIAACGDFAAWLPAAPLAIAVAVSSTSKRDEFDAGRAAQNMMVAAWADGVSSCPTSMHRVEDARQALGAARGVPRQHRHRLRLSRSRAEARARGGAPAARRVRAPEPLGVARRT